MSETTQDLTAAIASGNSEAFARFYREWFDHVFAVARRATGRDESFCLDVVQNAMIRTIRSIPVMNTEGELRAWLRAVTVSCAYDLLRREKRTRNREALARPVAESREPLDHERLAWLEEELARLDASVYPMIVLRFRLGWTLQRIGRLLGLRPGAVDGRIRRATQELREKAARHDD